MMCLEPSQKFGCLITWKVTWTIAACLLFPNFYHHRILFLGFMHQNPDIAIVFNGHFHLATILAAVEAAWITPRASGSRRARLCRLASSSRPTRRVTQRHRRATWCPTRRQGGVVIWVYRGSPGMFFIQSGITITAITGIAFPSGLLLCFSAVFLPFCFSASFLLLTPTLNRS